MSRILIVSAEAGGNVPPALAIAAELGARGHRVGFAGLRPRPGPWGDGAQWMPLPAPAGFDYARASGTVRVLRGFVHLARGADLEREVAAVVEREHPDAILVDCMLLSSVRAAVRSGVPTTVLFHSLMGFWAGPWAGGPLGMLAALRGLAPRRTWGAAALRLAVTERALDPAGDEEGLAVVWTGSTETGVPPLPRADGAAPLVLVSLSTGWQPAQAGAYARIVAALGELPVRAIVTTGGAEVGELHAPPNVEVLGRAPHEEILPHAALVIGHGGHSTTFRALAHGVPLLVLPMHPLYDQPMVAELVVRAGVGRTLPRTAATAAIRDAVAGLLADRTVADAAAALGAQLRSRDGASAAADRILATVPAEPPGRGAARTAGHVDDV